MADSLTIIIDDTDSSIRYTGDWTTDKGSLDNFSDSGPPFMGTSHYINGTGSLSWTFSGTFVGVYGPSVDGNNPNPSRVCTVDGVTIPNNKITSPVSSIMHCQVNGLKDGTHTIVVTVPEANPNAYWFDYFMYIPSASVDRSNSAMMVRFDDPLISYGTGWMRGTTFGTIARVNGASLSVKLTGPGSAVWMGYYLSQFPVAATTATYTIDGENPLAFDVNGIGSQITGSELNQRFFTTGPLSPGPHVLNVTYNGNNDTTPLSLYSFTVLNGTSSDVGMGGPIGASHPVGASSASTSTTSSSDSPSTSATSASPSIIIPSPTGGSSQGHNTNIGAIVGGLLGGLAFLILAALVFFIYRRKRRASTNRDGDSTRVFQPFPISPSVSPPMSEVLPADHNYSGSKGGMQNPNLLPTAQVYSDDMKRPLSPLNGGGGGGAVAASAPSAPPSGGPTRQPSSQQVMVRSNEPAPTDTAEPEVVILHEDSGVRLPTDGTPVPRPGVRVLEMPPMYSVS